MEAFIAGAWRTPSRAEVQVGGTWRTIARAEVYVSGAWRSALSFASPLSLSVTPSVIGVRSSSKPSSGTVTTSFATATPNGGVGPYTYAWVITGGVATAKTPSSASTVFFATVPADSSRGASAMVSCTDARGSTATGTVEITFLNESTGGPL